MVKYILLLTTAVASFSVFAQDNIGISLSVSNQGQIDRSLHDFYYPAGETAFEDDATSGKAIIMKYNLGLSYQLKNNRFLRLRLGYGDRNAENIQDYSSSYWRINDKQHFLELAPAFGFNEQIGRLRLSAGAEIPLYFISDFTQETYFEDIEAGTISEYTVKMDGGMIFGLNGFLNLGIDLTKHITLFSELNYGILHSDLGGKVTTTFFGPTAPPMQTDKAQSKTFFSGIQAQFGVAIRL